MNTKTNENPDKQKTCFVIMPIADMDGYETGHFARVYSHLIKPACEKAGYLSIRADDVASSNYIIIDILHKILESELVLCDLSGRNPNVLYELGIRQAFNLPTVLIKDIKTNKIFDIQGLRYTEYNQTLRVDEVVRDTALIQKSLLETEKASGTDINSLIQLLAVQPATRPSNVELSSETSVILSAVKDLANRISALEFPNTHIQMPIEKSQRIFKRAPKMIERVGEGSFIINAEKIDVGDDIYIDGKDLGVLADATPHSILVKNKAGELFEMTTADHRFKSVTLLPF
jgi:hypothetical protein